MYINIDTLAITRNLGTQQNSDNLTKSLLSQCLVFFISNITKILSGTSFFNIFGCNMVGVLQ